MPDPTGAPSPRALRLGVCGPVGTGKSSLIATICRELAGSLRLAVVTNDIYTDEDARFLRSAGVLPEERIVGVETGRLPAHRHPRRRHRQPDGGRGPRAAVRAS